MDRECIIESFEVPDAVVPLLQNEVVDLLPAMHGTLSALSLLGVFFLVVLREGTLPMAVSAPARTAEAVRKVDVVVWFLVT